MIPSVHQYGQLVCDCPRARPTCALVVRKRKKNVGVSRRSRVHPRAKEAPSVRSVGPICVTSGVNVCPPKRLGRNRNHENCGFRSNRPFLIPSGSTVEGTVKRYQIVAEIVPCYVNLTTGSDERQRSEILACSIVSIYACNGEARAMVGRVSKANPLGRIAFRCDIPSNIDVVAKTAVQVGVY